MGDAFSTVLPVVTLLLGAGLANYLKHSELRRSLRLEAADQLAQLPALLWNKTDPDAWLNLNAAVSRLVVRLNLAGVHPGLIERLGDSALSFFNSLRIVGQDIDGDVWTASPDALETWDEVSRLVAEVLGTTSQLRAWWIGRRATNFLRKWERTEKALLDSLDRSADQPRSG